MVVVDDTVERKDNKEETTREVADIRSRSHVYLHNKQTRVPYDVGNKIKG